MTAPGGGKLAIVHIMLRKLLSHRVRGFGAPELSPSALRLATRTAVPYLELDTRVSRDGCVFIHHDPVTHRPRLRFAGEDAASLRRASHENGEPLLTLEEALHIFRRRTHVAQRLCLDLKDFGFEEEHLRVVRAAGVEAHTHFISWIPQSIVRLHELGTRAPLHLSHANLRQYPLLALLTRPWSRSVRQVGRFVLVGERRHADELALRHGYQHALVCADVPTPLIEILAGSGGGICVHHRLAGRRLGRFCREHQLALWVFTARTASRFRSLAARDDVAVVFADNAASVVNADAGAGARA